jgi:hypothetical protein
MSGSKDPAPPVSVYAYNDPSINPLQFSPHRAPDTNSGYVTCQATRQKRLIAQPPFTARFAGVHIGAARLLKDEAGSIARRSGQPASQEESLSQFFVHQIDPPPGQARWGEEFFRVFACSSSDNFSIGTVNLPTGPAPVEARSDKLHPALHPPRSPLALRQWKHDLTNYTPDHLPTLDAPRRACPGGSAI